MVNIAVLGLYRYLIGSLAVNIAVLELYCYLIVLINAVCDKWRELSFRHWPIQAGAIQAGQHSPLAAEGEWNVFSASMRVSFDALYRGKVARVAGAVIELWRAFLSQIPPISDHRVGVFIFFLINIFLLLQ